MSSSSPPLLVAHLASQNSDQVSAFSDCVLVTPEDSRRFPCHRIILQAHSPKLKAILLEHEGRQDDEAVVVLLPEADGQDVEAALRWAYSGECGADPARLARGAEVLGIQGSPQDDKQDSSTRDEVQEDSKIVKRKRPRSKGSSNASKKAKLECCDEQFEEEVLLVAHKQGVHSEDPSDGGSDDKASFIICCGQKLLGGGSDSDSYPLHLRSVHRLDVLTGRSDCCDSALEGVSALARHCSATHGLTLATFRRALCCATRIDTFEQYRKHRTEVEHAECDRCAFLARDERHLSLHRKAKHKDGEVGVDALQCKYCGESFRQVAKRVDHEDRHESDPGKYPCSSCGKTFRLLSSLRSHVYRRGAKHKGKGYSCDECPAGGEGESFPTLVTKKEHLSSAHGKKNSSVCIECDVVFVDRGRLRDHVKSSHGGQEARDVQCVHCGKLFATRERMRVHERFVHVVEDSKVPCDMCNKEFLNRDRMVDHRRSVHRERKFQCESCGSTFKNSSTLKSHAASAHDPARTTDGGVGYDPPASSSSPPPLRCSACGKGFLHRSRLEAHLVVHSDEARFACAHCGRPNKSKSNNGKHEKRCKKKNNNKS